MTPTSKPEPEKSPAAPDIEPSDLDGGDESAEAFVDEGDDVDDQDVTEAVG